ncbi:MAG: response regulator transcription factor [Polaromonas sp.]|nr:response regulator transcription factor [Polaromonas sp.]
MKTIIIIDDHSIVRFGLQTLIDRSGTCRVVDSQDNLAKGVAAIARLAPDLVICDLSMDDSNGLNTVRGVVQAQAPRPVLLLSMHDEMIYAEQTLALGASGYLMKENAHEHLMQAINTTLSGDVWVSAEVKTHLLNRLMTRRTSQSAAKPSGNLSQLSQRELEVLEKIGAGKTTKQIAYDLELSPRTVDIHRANIKKKLGLKTSAEVVAFAMSRM